MKLQNVKRYATGFHTGIRRTFSNGWALTTVMAVAVLACGQEAPPRVDVMVLSSPAGPGSGMPHLEVEDGATLMSWLEPDGTNAERYLLMVSELRGDAWTDPQSYAAGEDFFVNWADFPSALKISTGQTVAHWLERGGRARYDYDVMVTAGPGDAERAWSPHQDGTPTEHGFVSMVAGTDGDFGLTWLDGRKYEAAKSGIGEEEMTLRYREATPEGPTSPETVLDERTCDCCQTDAARTADGVVVVYRDRSADEIRDISVVRRLGSGDWSEPRTVHPDGWEIPSCPVNGPAVVADGENVAVAWFTAADDTPRVRVAFSGDQAGSFGPAHQVDLGQPVGRADVVFSDDGSALVSWVEDAGAEGGEIYVRSVSPDGVLGQPILVAHTTSGRASGFPQMVRNGNHLVFSWKDPEKDRVLVATLELSE